MATSRRWRCAQARRLRSPRGRCGCEAAAAAGAEPARSAWRRASPRPRRLGVRALAGPAAPARRSTARQLGELADHGIRRLRPVREPALGGVYQMVRMPARCAPAMSLVVPAATACAGRAGAADALAQGRAEERVVGLVVADVARRDDVVDVLVEADASEREAHVGPVESSALVATTQAVAGAQAAAAPPARRPPPPPSPSPSWALAHAVVDHERVAPVEEHDVDAPAAPRACGPRRAGLPGRKAASMRRRSQAATAKPRASPRSRPTASARRGRRGRAP